jgi:hypothetical protein
MQIARLKVGLLATAVAAAALMAFAALALAGNDEKTTGGGQAYVGGQAPAGRTAVVGVSAQSGPNGPQGTVNLLVREADGTFVQHFVGDVTSYSQSGNTSTICGDVRLLELGEGNTNEGEFFGIVVQDNTSTGGPDMLFWHRKDTPAEACAGLTPSRELFAGNLVVHEGS